jgi:hypothetical protein
VFKEFGFPLLLGIALGLAGWGLTKVDAGFPEWAPTAAFVVAGMLFLWAVVGAFCSYHRRTRITTQPQSTSTVTSYGQRDGITAHTVRIGDGRGGR